jgi:hypothetical protein
MNQSPVPETADRDDEAIALMLQEVGDFDRPFSDEQLADLKRNLATQLKSARRARWWNPRRTRVLCVTVGVVAAAGCLFALLAIQPRLLWAQVVGNVQAMAWIHGTAPGPKGQAHEFWISYPREVSGFRHGGHVEYDDWRAGICFEFDPIKKVIVRRPVRDNGEFQSGARMFRAIFHGDLDAGFISPGFRIDARDVRSSEKDGRKWLDYEWMLSRHNDGKIIRVTMKVDAAARLPVSLQLDSGDQLLNYSFYYPAQGPADIYAMGVARETQIDDQLPSIETSRIAKAVDAARKDLDNYFAVVYDDLTVAHLVWRKGDKWRRAIYLYRGELADLPVPAPGEDMVAWWKRQLGRADAELHIGVVCDGTRIWRHDTETGWKRTEYVAPGKGHDQARYIADADSYLLEFQAYPRIAAGGRFVEDPSQSSPAKADVSHTPRPKAAPTLFEVASADVRNQRLWLDPEHGFAVVRDESTFGLSPKQMQEPNPITRGVNEFDKFRQTPRGVWYPTRRRNRRFRRDGAEALPGSEHHFAIDFQADLPDKLFTP